MDKVIMCGLDISTKKTGMCQLTNGELTDYALLDCSDINDAEERIGVMGHLIIESLNNYSPTILCVEDTWNKQNVKTTKMLSELIGVARGWAIDNDCDWNKLLPSEWRRLCGIEQGKKKREELKQESIDYVKRNFNIDVGDDVADSIAMAVGYCNIFDDEGLFE